MKNKVFGEFLQIQNKDKVMWEFRLSFTTIKNKNFFFVKYWYNQNFWVCFERLNLFLAGDNQSMKMHSSGLQPTSSSHLLLLDRSACQASFWWVFEMRELSEKDFTLVAAQMISIHVCTWKNTMNHLPIQLFSSSHSQQHWKW